MEITVQQPFPCIIFFFLYSIGYRGGNILFLRFFNSFIVLLTASLIYIYISKRFNHRNKFAALCISIAFLISPTIFGSSIFLCTDALPFLFIVLTALGLQRLRMKDGSHSILSILLISLASFSVFYTRQFFFWMPVLSFVAIIKSYRKRRNLFFLTLIYALLSLPVIYILFLWQGLTPPSLQDLHQTNHSPFSSLTYPLALLAIYALPLYAHTIFEKDLKQLNLSLCRNRSLRHFILCLLLPSLIFLFLTCISFGFYFAEAGMIEKLSSNPSSKIFLILASWLGFLIIGNWLRQNINTNYFWIPMTFQFIPTQVIYLRYIDPLLWLLIFLFTTSPHIRKFYGSKLMIYFPLASLGWWLIKAI